MENEFDNEKYYEHCLACLSKEQSESLSVTNGWEHVDKEQVHKDWDVLYKEIALLIDESKPGDVEIQKMVDRHYHIARRFYTPSKEAYIGM